jgi:hypothetical protein
MQIYSSGALTADLFLEVEGLMHQAEHWVALPTKTVTWRSMTAAFCMLSRLAAGVNQLMHQSFRGYPFRIFEILGADADAAARKILADSPCQRCSFSNAFIEKAAPSKSADGEELLLEERIRKLTSADVRFTLLCVAILVKCDTAKIECRHAAVRRLLRATPDCPSATALASARFVLLRHRVCLRRWSQCSKSGGRERPVLPKKKQPRRRGGGGGLCRAFMSEYLRGRPKASREQRKDLFAEGMATFRELSDTDREALRRKAMVGTVAHRTGGRAFGPLAKKLKPASRVAALQQSLKDFDTSTGACRKKACMLLA